ncbi:MAG: DUF2094 domain-containing protein [Phycisphaerae bacterium]|mgnify:CR=1 FL=1|nr:DUF2094 domain-containing protein [Phycisphaerae bacterium]
MNRWTDIFKFRSGETKLKADPRLRWFGKLPTYADYYSSPADEEWVTEFNDWLLKGYEVYHHRQHEGGHKGKRVPLPVTNCAIRLPKSHVTVLASIQDYGGDMRGRPFPLTFYVGVPSAQWPGPIAGSSWGAMSVLARLSSLRHEVMRFSRAPGRFESVFGDREVDVEQVMVEGKDDGWLDGARRVSLTTWFDGLKAGLSTENLGVWLGLVGKWGETIAALESESFEPTFCFPLAAGLPMDMQVAAWLRWLEPLMELERRSLSLMVTEEREGGGGRLLVIARDLVQEDFLLLTPLYRSLAYLDDLTAVKPKESAGGGSNGPVDAADAVPDLPETLADFVVQRMRAS